MLLRRIKIGFALVKCEIMFSEKRLWSEVLSASLSYRGRRAGTKPGEGGDVWKEVRVPRPPRPREDGQMSVHPAR